LLAPAGAIIYLLLSALLITLAGIVFPQIDLQQAQEIGFRNLADYSQYLLAFLTLVVVAPLAEEILFRGYLYGKLRKHAPLWLAMLVTSGLFGLAHGQWNVAIDTFALSAVMCSLREVTGSIWAGVLLHMLKNGLAFYLLFINPSLLNTIGG
jgi:membrane protease YdiL (CAAX protease family)